MKPFIIFSILYIFPSFIFNSYSQGCSDAGFCSINSLKTLQSDTTNSNYSNQFKLGGSYGKADHDIAITGGFVEYHKDVNACTSLDLRLSYISQKNDLAKSNGLSDLFININWLIGKDLHLITGCKFALSNGNADVDGSYLPMDFQHSLGTFDLILGFNYKVGGLQLFLAGQQPLNKSKNKFLSESYPSGSGFREYQSTNDYKRKGDILFRAAYPIALGEKFTITPSVLPIYHLSDDEFSNALGETEIIKDSKGLTVNANLFIDYTFNNRNKISLSFAAPVATRKVRPDGLTRKFIAGLEYAIRF
jgi:hypothetical protein